VYTEQNRERHISGLDTSKRAPLALRRSRQLAPRPNRTAEDKDCEDLKARREWWWYLVALVGLPLLFCRMVGVHAESASVAFAACIIRYALGGSRSKSAMTCAISAAVWRNCVSPVRRRTDAWKLMRPARPASRNTASVPAVFIPFSFGYAGRFSFHRRAERLHVARWLMKANDASPAWRFFQKSGSMGDRMVSQGGGRLAHFFTRAEIDRGIVPGSQPAR